MILNLEEAAKLLAVPEVTIRRWIRQGKIPVREGRGQYFFVKKELEKWARTHNIFLHRDLENTPSQYEPDENALHEAMRRGGVFFNVEGKEVDEVLRNAVSLCPLPPQVDREFLMEMLLQREKLASTGIGKGVAIPHPRYPLAEFSNEPLITTCFLHSPVDFHAVDGIPVFVIFLMLSPTTKAHLFFLSRLSFCLRDQTFMSFLKQCSAQEELLQKIAEMEDEISGEKGFLPASPGAFGGP